MPGAPLASLAVLPVAAQFRVAAEHVVVDVEVLADGKPVAGLSREDFGVFDNGVERPVTGFGLEDRDSGLRPTH